MRLLGVVAVCGLVTLARADAPRFDPFAYPHGGPVAPQASAASPELAPHHAAPALEAALARQIHALLDLRGVGPGLLAPKGDRLFYSSAVTGTLQVWRQDGPGTFPRQLTGGEDPTTLEGIAPDGSFLVVARDGTENRGLYLQAPGGGPLRAIEHDPNVQASLAYVADDARAVYYRANDRDPASFAFYRFDVKTGAKELMFDQAGVWAIADHRGDEWLLRKTTGSASAEIYRYNLSRRALVPLLGQNESEDYAVAFGARANEILVRTDKPGEVARLYTYDGHRLTPISPDVSHDVDAFRIDDARARIYYTLDDRGSRRLTVLDARTFRPVTVPKLEAESIAIANVSHDGRFAQLTATGSRQLEMTYVLDWTTRKLVTWRSPQTPEVDVSKFVKAELETFPARDGVQIPMFVRRPASCATAATPCPVVVRFHGGPDAQATAAFAPWAQLFVEHGFVVVEPNVRGSSGYGKSWSHADDGAKRLDVITDIEDCALYVKKTWARSGVAPKLGVMGAGYGGYTSLLAMSLYAGAYDAGVAEDGMANLVTFVASPAERREYGDPVKDKLALAKLSPINYVDRIKAPLLIVHSGDPRVTGDDALQIYDALRARKTDSRLILVGDGAAKRGNVALVLGNELAFFEQHLK